MKLRITEEIADALNENRAVVALESTVIAHGLPFPHNLSTARGLEQRVRSAGAVPATIAVFGGEFHVGISASQIEHLAQSQNVRKISRRDLAIARGLRLDCATTVATTAWIAHRAGIKVFATGGIGGVHRGYDKDISADLPELAQTPITVVCSGAKIVLDLPATREWLETHGVPVIGWKCDDMPAFYSQSSGLAVDARVENAADAATIIRSRDELGLSPAVLLTVPVPHEIALDRGLMESILAEALKLADERGIKGKEITPFLLAEMSARSEGKTLAANIALLENNAGVAAEIAMELAVSGEQ